MEAEVTEAIDRLQAATEYNEQQSAKALLMIADVMEKGHRTDTLLGICACGLLSLILIAIVVGQVMSMPHGHGTGGVNQSQRVNVSRTTPIEHAASELARELLVKEGKLNAESSLQRPVESESRSHNAIGSQGY